MRKLSVLSAIVAITIMSAVAVVVWQVIVSEPVGGSWYARTVSHFPESGGQTTRLCRRYFGIIYRCGDTVGSLAYIGSDCVTYRTQAAGVDVIKVACDDRSPKTLGVGSIGWIVTGDGLENQLGLRLSSGGLVERKRLISAAGLREFALSGSEPTIRETVTSVPIDFRSRASGRTALIDAVISRDHKLVQDLLDRGADPNARDDAGSTALSFAAEAADSTVTARLLQGGAQPDAGDANGVTPLMRAVMRRDLATTKLLVEYGANPSAHDAQGDTPLAFAEQSRWSAGIEILRSTNKEQR